MFVCKYLREERVINKMYTVNDNEVSNQLTLPSLSKADLGSILTCQASNSNLSVPVSTSVKLDLTFPPEEVVIRGAEHYIAANKHQR